jgi:Flp pilus assembly protein TadG
MDNAERAVMGTRVIAGRRSESGQALIAFVVLIPVFILALFIVLDLGRYQIMRNQVRIAADSAALAAAGALDAREAGAGNFVVNENWAYQRAADSLLETSAHLDEPWMTLSLLAVDVEGAEVLVRVNGNASTVFGTFPLIGISGFSATAESKARAATGVDVEW